MDPRAIVLYLHITRLTINEGGYCWCGNAYFQELTGYSIRVIQRCLRQLVELDCIAIEFPFAPDQRERHIRMVDSNICQPRPTGHGTMSIQTRYRVQPDAVIYKEERIEQRDEEKRERRVREVSVLPPPPVVPTEVISADIHRFGERVRLTTAEVNGLKRDYTDAVLLKASIMVDGYYTTKPKGGWAHAIRRWIERDKSYAASKG